MQVIMPTTPGLIEDVWKNLEAKMKNNCETTIENVRAGFCAAVYACAAAIVHEQAKSRELSEAAQRIEGRKI